MKSYVAGHAGLRHSTPRAVPCEIGSHFVEAAVRMGGEINGAQCGRDRVDRENWMRILDSVGPGSQCDARRARCEALYMRRGWLSWSAAQARVGAVGWERPTDVADGS